ncbi:hypothetical protein ACA910_018527 [Epithemia clementina (nom. ined.)]
MTKGFAAGAKPKQSRENHVKPSKTKLPRSFGFEQHGYHVDAKWLIRTSLEYVGQKLDIDANRVRPPGSNQESRAVQTSRCYVCSGNLPSAAATAYAKIKPVHDTDLAELRAAINDGPNSTGVFPIRLSDSSC